MVSRFSWHGCSYCFQAISIVVMLVAIFSGYASAQGVPQVGNPEMAPSDSQGNQEVPSAGNPEMVPSDSQGDCSGLLCQLHFSDLKVGIFWGGGSMIVDRNIAPGPAYEIPGIPLFAGFKHRAETSLNDVFVAGEWGFRWGDMLVGTTSLDTNIGRETQFKQTSFGTGETIWVRRYNMYVLGLPVDANKGVITLDNKNRIFNLDQCFTFPKEIAVFASPMMPKLRFLAGWKYSLISSDIDPYSAAHAPLVRETLPGQIGWENLWRNAVPFTTSFTMAQEFWWTGPYLGMRLAGPTPQKLPGQWYVEGKGVPYAWGNYKFDWNAAYEDGFFFVRGQQTTNERLDGYFLEVKGGAQIKLVGRLFLDVWSKYSYLNMKGSGWEKQSEQNNFLAVQALSQAAAQSIDINENFWAVGVNLVLHF